MFVFFFFQAEDGIRDLTVTGVQTCALPIYAKVSMFIRPVRTPRHDAIPRFCITARISKPSGVLVKSNQVAMTITTAKQITKTRFKPKLTSAIEKCPRSQEGEFT